MVKLTKEQLQAALRKPILGCTEDEIRFPYHIMGFDLKNFQQEQGRVAFEIHYQRFYIIKVEVAGGILTFSNQWVIFNEKEDVHHLSFEDPGKLIFILNYLISLFGKPLLEPAGYRPAFIKGHSICETPEEAKDYWMIIQEVLYEFYPELRPDADPKKVSEKKPEVKRPQAAKKSGKKGKVVKFNPKLKN